MLLKISGIIYLVLQKGSKQNFSNKIINLLFECKIKLGVI